MSFTKLCGLLSKYFGVSQMQAQRLKKHCDVFKLYELLKTESFTRDEFYALFNDEKTADLYWARCFEDFGVQEDLSVCLDWE